MKKLIKEYFIELMAATVVLAGLFLQFEQFNIRETFLRIASGLADSLASTADTYINRLVLQITEFTFSDIAGWLLVIPAITLIIWRIRYRFLSSARWQANTCPRCGSLLHRTHRTQLDRLLGQLLMPHSRRYRCKNSDCSWSGLRHHRNRDLQQPHLEENFLSSEAQES